ncbi:hypothetical protein CALCODRAFT_93640 [Calocera cornea HHB12733]|uniref:Uncharacterized protein n=1 Tax=Calocera cornea HHB12733 TaxID=1353952 RepID=A0A165D8I0_9BASI|nr:hypothetical protein CALCODRAFT_93640 [Calocera cornea HHB12733]
MIGSSSQSPEQLYFDISICDEFRQSSNIRAVEIAARRHLGLAQIIDPRADCRTPSTGSPQGNVDEEYGCVRARRLLAHLPLLSADDPSTANSHSRSSASPPSTSTTRSVDLPTLRCIIYNLHRLARAEEKWVPTSSGVQSPSRWRSRRADVETGRGT